MDVADSKLADLARRFAIPSNLISGAAVLFDWALYVGAVIVAVLAPAAWMKVLAVVVAGTAISMLFILGHDAAHRSLFSGRRANAISGRLLFLPCLHNYSLWVVQHNLRHHRDTNVKGLNSYSPMTWQEYSAARPGRRALERIYRSPLGFGIYYLVERWWKDKFFPRSTASPSLRRRAFRDFGFLIAWIVALSIFLLLTNEMLGDGSAFAAILWGGLAPFLVWNQLMGTTAFLQHTHPSVHWFTDGQVAAARESQAERTIHVQFPAWYDLLSHNIMQHQAHHVSARIPWFRLKSAQTALAPLLSPTVVVERVTIPYLFELTRRCQLYDYESQMWLTFDGQRLVERHMVDEGQKLASPIEGLNIAAADRAGN